MNDDANNGTIEMFVDELKLEDLAKGMKSDKLLIVGGVPAELYDVFENDLGKNGESFKQYLLDNEIEINKDIHLMDLENGTICPITQYQSLYNFRSYSALGLIEGVAKNNRDIYHILMRFFKFYSGNARFF